MSVATSIENAIIAIIEENNRLHQAGLTANSEKTGWPIRVRWELRRSVNKGRQKRS